MRRVQFSFKKEIVELESVPYLKHDPVLKRRFSYFSDATRGAQVTRVLSEIVIEAPKKSLLVFFSSAKVKCQFC